MAGRLSLQRLFFTQQRTLIFQNEAFKVYAFKYASGIEALRIENQLGFITVLPYYGQMIWDAEFKNQSLKMENMFSEPKIGQTIIETYGCFCFHSGLLSNGCPSPEDHHPLHGELPCATMDRAWLTLSDDRICVGGSYEHVRGFGHHYRAEPEVVLHSNRSLLDIGMTVTNMASVEMPLQYMCHINYAYIDNAKLTQNFPSEVLQLRETVPNHVKPTPKWLEYTKKLKLEGAGLDQLSTPNMYDPEIVFFMDRLDRHTHEAEFRMETPQGHYFITRFETEQLNYATRWILYNGDQKVAAFALPATCRPEGFNAAKENGTLLYLAAKESRSFSVTTGLVDA